MQKFNNETEGVITLLGDPKKAIIKLAIPMIVALSVTTLYNLVDTWWVSGIGPDALAAVGFVFPFFMMATAISTGIGVGAGSAISRKIGAKNKDGADSIATHTIIIMIIAAIIFSIVLLIFSNIIFEGIGAGNILEVALGYSQIIFAGSIFIFFTQIGFGILRAEGDTKRAMYAMVLGAILNIFLDPIFIYKELKIGDFSIPGLDLGVPGAAWATVISLIISSMIMFYWLFIKKDTFVTFNFRKFKFKRLILKDIFSIAIPASVQQISMSVTMIVITIILTKLVGTGSDGIAIYQTGWKVATIALMPLLAIATSVVSVVGATFGAKNYSKLNNAYIYAIKIGLLIEIILAIIIYLSAPIITASFTTAEESARIYDDLKNFIMIICVFYPGVPFGMFTSSMFQGTGKGLSALIVTLLRTIILTTFFTILFSVIFNFGINGVWWGLVLANLTGSFIAFMWGKIYINSLFTKKLIDV